MMKRSVMSKYDFVFDGGRVIDSSSETVPGLVLSMYDIYRKYAVTRDIGSLPGLLRPFVNDDGDELEDYFEGEEMTDSLLYAKELRESKPNSDSSRTRQPAPAHPAAEDTPVGEAVKKQDDSPAPKPQDTQVPSDAYE